MLAAWLVRMIEMHLNAVAALECRSITYSMRPATRFVCRGSMCRSIMWIA